MKDLPPLIVITGPTASGKTDLSLALADQFSGEIVSADSRQIYKGFDLCSGKITESEQKRVPHHLIDVAKITQPLTLGDFLPMAHQVITEIGSRKHLPFLVGGTPLYISAVVENYLLPNVEAHPEVRAQLEGLSLEELQKRLEKVDPEAPIEANNRSRIIRALEVYEVTGQAFSTQKQQGPACYHSLVLALDWPREELYARIDKRVENRLKAGMLEEVQKALSTGVPYERLWQLGLEFRFLADFLTGRIASQEEMKTKLKYATHAFARRQLIWLRKKPYVIWLDAHQDLEKRASELIHEHLV